ncbi:protein sel-1 homolog 3-like [Babylonia areolata]|uniref:protein sel-1 homolog 3-like n=1 Tax=Babylonia areolata TaxID=304850 RepID=UPI003FD09724
MRMTQRCVLALCLLLVVCLVPTLLQGVGETNAEGDGDEDFVAMSSPPDPITWRTRFKVKYVCTTDKIIGVSLHIATPLNTSHLHSWKVWRCRGNDENIALRIRRVRIPMADDIAFRPSVLTPHSTVVDDAVVTVWMVEGETWTRTADRDKHRIHQRAISRKSFSVNIAPPYSRPYKTVRKGCVPWFWSLLQQPRLSDTGVCLKEELEVRLLSFPVVLNGQKYGVHRSLSPFTDPVLESQRVTSLLSPRFSLELWVFLLEYCPEFQPPTRGKPCTLFAHLSPQEAHLTPVILVTSEGKLQVEARGPDMYVAHLTTFAIPRRQWVRILFSLSHRTWTLACSYGQSHNVTHTTHVRYTSDVHYDDTEGVYVIGGVDGRLGSVSGYIGRVTLYRGQLLTLEELPLPESRGPMFGVDVRSMEERCHAFRQWWGARVQFYTHRGTIYLYKHSCPNTYHQVCLGRAASDYVKTCPRRHGPPLPHTARLSHLLRSAVSRDGHLTSTETDVIARRLLEDVTRYVEREGLSQLHNQLPLVRQSSCLGNLDATFTLAVFLNNGVATSLDEHESVSLLMLGSLHQHRLSSLALGHRHAMGTDGLPLDLDTAYMYYKDVGDKTREDLDKHPEDQVTTETVRLMDEQTLQQQTDEGGDLFNWLSHQAQHGVASAQSHLAHLYFWGTQGMRRNLQAARGLFQQGAQRGDPDSIYNLAMMDYLGKGGSTKNETAGKERLEKVAQKQHPHAVSFLGWIALERDKNYSQAAAYFQQALRLNFRDAGYYLGHMHHTGIYPDKPLDYDTALYYYEWAAMRGHVTASLLFAQFLNRGTPKMKRSSHLALEWARYIAEQNSAIGRLLRRGVQTYREGNIPLSAYYYLLAADTGVEVSSFNLAWLCEERKEEVTAAFSKECQWRHYNFTVHRQAQFVDPYSYIKMGDYFWYGCQGKRNVTQAAIYYAAAGKKHEPHALFNLAFMVEDGAHIPQSVWTSLGLRPHHCATTVTLLSELYERCRESKKSEAFIPCTLALYRVWLVDLWDRYHVYLQTSSYVGVAVAVVGAVYFVLHCVHRAPHPAVGLHQL